MKRERETKRDRERENFDNLLFSSFFKCNRHSFDRLIDRFGLVFLFFFDCLKLNLIRLFNWIRIGIRIEKMNKKTNSELLMLGPKGIMASEKRDVSGAGLTFDPAYKSLRELHDQKSAFINLNELFKNDPQRFEKYQ